MAAREDRATAPPAGYASFETQLKGRTVSVSYPHGWGAVERRTESGVQTFDADAILDSLRLRDG